MIVKDVWSDSNWSEMGWHDSRLYSFVIPSEDFQLRLDIDYIFKWVKEIEEHAGFWVSPCELVFFNVANLKIDIDFADNMLLFISDIKRSNQRPTPNGRLTKWDYEIECDNGVISFSATGFEQAVIKQPILAESQDLGRD